MQRPIAKLTFSNKFFGRDYECDRLHEAFARIGQDPLAILVGGYSGTGKTRLVQHVVHELRDKQAGKGESKPFFYCSGKADELLSTDPFSSIVKALAHLLKILLPEERTVFRERILRAVGTEGKVLTDLLPELEDLIGPQPEPVASTAVSSMNRFTYLFQALIRAICSPEKPLVMYLDDLQWTDASSLGLIRSLLMDKDLHHFLFIGSYRDNEIDVSHALSALLRRLGDQHIYLSLGNLSMNETKEWVQDTLRLDEVDELVSALYERTHGNVFYMKASLQQLEQKKILRYSLATCAWEWDAALLKKEVEMSDNVVSLVLGNLQGTDEKLQTAMMIAAHLRSSFSLCTLYSLMKGWMDYPGDMQSLIETLEQGVISGFLESDPLISDVYHFVHDRVRQASLLLAKEEGRHLGVSLSVSRFLLSRRDQEEWMLFAAVDHLNSIPLGVLKGNGLSTLDLVRLNLRAGHKAAQLSAFAPAVNYYNRGVALIEELPARDRWMEHYCLCLDLYSSAAEVEFCMGSLEIANSHTNEVLANAVVPSDAVRAYTSLAESLGRQDRHLDSVDIYMKILGVLDEKPRGLNLIQILRKLNRVKDMFRKLSPDEISDLPWIQDAKRVEAIETLNRAIVRAMWAGKKLLTVWVTLRICEIAVSEGVCAASVSGISSLGAMLSSFDPPILDVELGRKLGEGARKLTAKLGARSMETRILFTSNGCVLHRPISSVDCLLTLFEAILIA